MFFLLIASPQPEKVLLRRKPPTAPQQSELHSPPHEVTRRALDKNVATQSPILRENPSRYTGQMRSYAVMNASESSRMGYHSQQNNLSNSKPVPVSHPRSTPALPETHSGHPASKYSQHQSPFQSSSTSPSSHSALLPSPTSYMVGVPAQVTGAGQAPSMPGVPLHPSPTVYSLSSGQERATQPITGHPALLPSPTSYMVGVPAQVTGAGQATSLHGVPLHPSPAVYCFSAGQEHATQPITGLPFEEDMLWQQQQVGRRNYSTSPSSFAYAEQFDEPVYKGPGGFSQQSPSPGSPLLPTSPSLTPPSPRSSQIPLHALQLQHWSQPCHPQPNFQTSPPLLPSPGMAPAMYNHWYGAPQANSPFPPSTRTGSYPYTAWPTYQHMQTPPRK